MGLTPFEEAAFRLLSIFHFCMWPFPVKWDYCLSVICINKPIVKLIPFAHFLCLGFLFGWVCFIAAFAFKFIFDRPLFGIANATILLLAWAGLVGVFIVVVIIFRNSQAAITFLTEIIQIADILEQDMFVAYYGNL